MATAKSGNVPEVSKDEQIGYHKGSVETLLKERQELYRLITIVDALLKMHVGELQKLGVKFQVKQELEKKL